MILQKIDLICKNIVSVVYKGLIVMLQDSTESNENIKAFW